MILSWNPNVGSVLPTPLTNKVTALDSTKIGSCWSPHTLVVRLLAKSMTNSDWSEQQLEEGIWKESKKCLRSDYKGDTANTCCSVNYRQIFELDEQCFALGSADVIVTFLHAVKAFRKTRRSQPSSLAESLVASARIFANLLCCRSQIALLANYYIPLYLLLKTDVKKMRLAFLSIAPVVHNWFLQFKVFLKAG